MVPNRTQDKATNLVISKRKQLLPQPIPVLLGPFISQELDDLLASLEEGIPISPDRVGSIRKLDDFRLSL